MSQPPVKTLKFGKDFKCESCTQCCRSEWRIPLLQEDYDVVARVLTAKYGADKVGDYLEKIAGDPLVAGTFRRKVGNACVFLNESTNLCGFQTEFGESALPAVCKTYPRMRVRVGEEQSYALSATCPTARRLFTRENEIAVITRNDFDTGIYSGVRQKLGERPLTLNHRVLDFAAYCDFKEFAVTLFGRTEFDVDGVVAGVGALLMGLYDSQGEGPLTRFEMQSWLGNSAWTEFTHFADASTGMTAAPLKHLGLLGSWCRHRQTQSSVDQDVMRVVVAKYAPQSLSAEEAEAYVARYRGFVDPVLAKNHWIPRNYLAGKFFLDPYAVKLDYLGQGFLSVFFAWALLKAVLVETSYKKSELTADDVLAAIEVVEHNTSHAGTTEEELARLMKENRVLPGIFLSLIRL